MKASNLNIKQVELSFGSLHTIVLGETGRGRNRTLVPADPTIKNGDRVNLATTKSGGVKVVKAENSSDDDYWLFVINTKIRYSRYNSYICDLPENAEVIAEGNFADGDAGRTSRSSHVLIKAKVGTLIEFVSGSTSSQGTIDRYIYVKEDGPIEIYQDEVSLLKDSI
ncbi:hypothetical protein [Pseudomonas sp.]|uniref:hypothetical protein n=1 Tax=Pseudomonas sp. TaxID=306 RepID=UPI000F965B29